MRPKNKTLKLTFVLYLSFFFYNSKNSFGRLLESVSFSLSWILVAWLLTRPTRMRISTGSQLNPQNQGCCKRGGCVFFCQTVNFKSSRGADYAHHSTTSPPPGAPMAFKTWCGHKYIGWAWSAPLVEIGLRWLPKLGVDMSPRPHAHRRACLSLIGKCL